MILYFNTDNDISTAINSITKSKGKDITSIFMIWIPTEKGTSQTKASALLSQTEVLEKYTKTIPIVIFDRYRSITKEEHNWLKKFKVTFFEPSICPREGFKYLPNWTKIKTLDDIKLNEMNRNINLGYIGSISDRSKSFEKYYVKPKSLNDIVVSYHSKSIQPNNEQEYSSLGMQNSVLDFKDIEFSVILGSINDYIVGHLDQFYFRALEHNCIPIVPAENRYYSALLTCDTHKWYDTYFKMYDTIYIGMIHDIYERIRKYYPEMDIKYTAEIIKKYLGEK